jgi:ABC-2 type transport system permease protein
MRNIWTIAKREYNHYFITPIAYAVAIVILLAIVIQFVLYADYLSASALQGYGGTPTVEPITGLFTFMLIFMAPMITMRLVSEEARTGTLELLMTAPVRDHELITGKWLGALLFALTLLGVTLVYPLVLNSMVDNGIDQRVVFTAYLGSLLAAAAILALGTGFSAVFSNQIAAVLLTFFTLLFLWWFVSFFSQIIQSPSAVSVFEYLPMQTHLSGSFQVGTLRLSDVVYFLSLTALGLFIGTTALDVRRWR